MSVHSGGKPPDLGPSGAISGIGKKPLPLDNLMDTQDSIAASGFYNEICQKNNETITGNQLKTSVSKAQSNFLYQKNDLGPFHVLIENSSSDFKGKLNVFKINDIIYSVHPELDNKIKEIDSVGRNRIRVNFKDSHSANILVNSKYLETHNLDAYIPKYLVLRQGVISGIDTDITEEYLKNKINQFDSHCSFTVHAVRRITKTIFDEKDQQKKRINTRSVIVTFKSQVLPKYVAIGHVKCEVNAFVQKVVLCYNCFRYGHTKQQCKSKSRCPKCEGNHKVEECEVNGKKCFHCDGPHLPNDIKKCSEFTRQKLIKKSMAENNLSYKDAEKSFPKKSYASALINGSASDVDLEKLDLVLAPSQSQLKSTNQIKSPYFTQLKVPAKRIRPASPNPILNQHREILSQFNLSQTGKDILNDPHYKQGLEINPGSLYKSTNYPSTSNSKQAGFNFDTIVELVISVLNTIRERNSFDINKTELKELINSRLVSSN